MFAVQVKIPVSAVRAVCRWRTGMDDDAGVLGYLSAPLLAAAEAVDAEPRRRRRRCNDRIGKCLPASEDASTVLLIVAVHGNSRHSGQTEPSTV